MLPRRNRLTSAQFERTFATSQVVRHPLVQARARFRHDGEDAVRAAFVVPKKQSKANERNRTRRRLRERFRLSDARSASALAGCDLIFMATPATAAASNAELDAALEEVLRRLGKKMKGDKQAAPSRKMVELSMVAEPTAEELMAKEPMVESPEERVGEARTEEVAEQATNVAFVSSHISFIAQLALSAIRFYQRFISPGLPPSCRFTPTCSSYTYGAIERFGLVRGTLLGAHRICRCQPLSRGGFDPVPEFFPSTDPRPFLARLLAPLRFARWPKS